jgi:hypothetical protein
MMKVTKKKVTFIAIAIFGLLLIETGREIGVFLSWSRFYEKAYWTIDGRRYQDVVTKGELREIAGPPTREDKGTVESWSWEAAQHRGPVLRILPLPLTRHPYRLSVEFDENEFVRDVFAASD